MEDYNTLVLTPIDDHGGFAEDLNRWQPPLDLAVLDDLNTVDESLAEDIFDPDQLAHVPAHLTSETRTITLNEAEQSGILDLEG